MTKYTIADLRRFIIMMGGQVILQIKLTVKQTQNVIFSKTKPLTSNFKQIPPWSKKSDLIQPVLDLWNQKVSFSFIEYLFKLGFRTFIPKGADVQGTAV